MNKQQAQQIIQETFESSFDKGLFIFFIKNLLNHVEEASFTYRGNYIQEKFRPYIKSLERIGKFSDGENSLDILIITLKKETSLERARTMQRNFIAWYLNGSRGGEMKDAALVAYVSPVYADWRFSLVKMDYKFEKTKTDKVKVKEKFTPARRWSFLVGANEKSHTAQSRLVNILANDEQPPTLAELENAFDIEIVTKEFFLKYRELFLRTKEALDKVVKNDPKIKADFEAKGVDTINFAKKLLGQIVFLYFLQKKGWFGVGRDDDWGTGSKRFLRELFDKKHSDYHNFFNDILEPLFYEALRIDRSHDDHYYSRFNCKIPFLNGGLFDPIGNYDWVHTDINLPNDLFSNSRKTKEGDTGDGILDVFDRYNFTVREDEPLEKEVAIDPELLGKAYEKFNAIRPDNFDEFTKVLKSGKKGAENKFNKKFGVYYTPREIVHYMCKQSLINYLYTQAEDAGMVDTIKKQDIEDLIEVGELITEHEATVLIKQEKIKSGIQKSTEYTALLSDSIRENAAAIDKWLADITVCDPAVGSGAFPVGMMNEIVHARNVLSVFLNDNARNDYEFKRHCIEHSLYGVDIDSGAVEITKLRLWLSLVVDEEDIKTIKPLPNLDYRIMQGNSLISEFMGINFDAEPQKENQLFKNETDELIERFQQKKNKFLNESNVAQKVRLKEEVENLLVEIFETKLRTQKADYFKKLKDIEEKYAVLSNKAQREKLIQQEKKKLYKEFGFDLGRAEKQLKEFTGGRQIKPFFLWNLYFSEVFHQKGGFDVVIANPPYVRADSGHEYLAFRKKLEESKVYKTLYEKWDLMVPFIEKGLNIANPKGDLIYIVSNAICTSKYAFKLLDLIQEKYFLRSIDYFEDMAVFEAGVIPVVFHISKSEGYGITQKNIRQESFKNIVNKSEIPTEKFKSLGRNAFRKEYNPIMPKTKTIPVGDICYISYGLRPNSNERYWKGEFSKNDLIRDHKDITHCKQYVEGKDINRYIIKKIKFLEWGTDRVPKKLVRKTFPELYDRPKIMRGRVTGGIYDDTGLLCNDSIVVFVRFIDLRGVNNKSIQTSITKFNNFHRSQLEKVSEKFNLKYLLTILNSAFALKYLNDIRRHRLKNYFYPDDFRKLPIADITPKEQKPFIIIANKILAITKAPDYLQNPTKQAQVKEYERQIDRMIYDLYGLTGEEIRIVEGKG